MEERFNNKLDDFIDRISNLLKQNIGTDNNCDNSDTIGRSQNYNQADGATKQTSKAERKKQHLLAKDKTKRSGSKHLKQPGTQNDNWSRSHLSDAEERRLAVQNLLPGGPHGSSGSTLFKTPTGAPPAQRDWRLRPANYTSGAVTWLGGGTQGSSSSHIKRHSRQQHSSQVRQLQN